MRGISFALAFLLAACAGGAPRGNSGAAHVLRIADLSDPSSVRRVIGAFPVVPSNHAASVSVTSYAPADRTPRLTVASAVGSAEQVLKSQLMPIAVPFRPDTAADGLQLLKIAEMCAVTGVAIMGFGGSKPNRAGRCGYCHHR